MKLSRFDRPAKNTRPMNKRVNVDFDETLTTGAGPPFWKEDSYEEPDEEMVEWVNERYKDGDFITIWTAREWTQAGAVAGYCTMWGIMYHGIRCAKGGADLYVDDRSKRPQEVV